MTGVFVGSIRPVETRTLEVQAHSLAEAHAIPRGQHMDASELADAPVGMSNETTPLAATAMHAHRDSTRLTDAVTGAGLDAPAPLGWESVFTRSA